jgi:hypothetical protein
VILKIGVSKKTKKLRKPEKNNRKNRTVKKNRLKFGKNRTEPKPKKKTSQTEKTEPNLFEPVFVLKTEPKPIGLVRVRFRFFYIKKFDLVIFF